MKSKQKKNKKAFKIVFGIVFVLLAIMWIGSFNVNTNNYFWDEVVYLQLGDTIHNTGDYSSEIGETFRAPMWPFVVSIFQSETFLHLLNVLLIIGTAALLYFFVKKHWGQRAGLIAGILLLSNQLLLFWGFKVLTENLSLFFLVLGFILFYEGYHSSKKGAFYASALVAGLLLMTRYPLAILMVVFIIFLLWKEKLNFFKQYKNYLFILIFLVSICPIYILSMINYGNPIGMLIHNFVQPYGKLSGWLYIKGIWGVLTYTIILFIAGIIKFGIKPKNTGKKAKNNNKQDSFHFLYLFLAVHFIALNILGLKQIRFLLHLLPLFFIIAAVGFVKIVDIIKRIELKWVTHLILIVLVITTSFLGLSHVYKTKNNTALLIESTKKLSELPGENVYCNSYPYCSYFGKKQPRYFWPFEDFHVGLEGQDYMFIDNIHGVPDYYDYIKDHFELIYRVNKTWQFIEIYGVEES